MARLSPEIQSGPFTSALFADDLEVVAYAGLLRQPEHCAPRSRFADDNWDFSAVAGIPAYARRPRLLRVDWTSVEHPVWRLCAKELGLALLQPAVGLDRRLADARRLPLPPHNLGHHLNRWRAWFDWLALHGVAHLAEVTQAHCDVWLAGRRLEVDPSTIRADVRDIRLFDDYGPILTLDGYGEGFRPWGSKIAGKVAGCKDLGENSTAVIPDEVYGPLLAAAMFLVQVAGADVLAAREAWQHLQQRKHSYEGVDERLDRHLAGLRRAGLPLPELASFHLASQRGRGILDETDPLRLVNTRLIELQIGVSRGSVTRSARRRARLEAALADLGCSGGGLTAPVATVADPANFGRCQPWHQTFSPYDLQHLTQLIHTACYVVVAALSGLRRSELAEMRRGCVRAEELATGKVRYRVHAKLIKGKPFGGQDERWTVIKEVAQAFSMVESMTDADQPFARYVPEVRLLTLIRWINGPGARAFLAPIPDWHFTGRQFRRTLARLLGFRPHGVLAGKVHLKHISVVTSEGYYGRAGSSAAAFLAEVEQETVVARNETTRRLYADWMAGEPIGGPGRAELTKLFGAVAAEMASFEGSVIDSDRRVAELLRRRADTLHVGPLNNCWFVDPARAHCLKQAGRADATTPLIGMCEPTRCPNATIHPEQVSVWLDNQRHIDKLIANPRVPKQEKERLAVERPRVHAVVQVVSGNRAPR